MGVGVIIRDAEGQVTAAKSMTIPGVFEPAAGEAVAALHAVELCRDIGIFEVVLEGDSIMVTKAISGIGENWLRFGQIVEDIKLVLRSFRQWRVSHVRRTANAAAHGLAKEATMRQLEKIWMEESPECISRTIGLELEALSL
jgi:ribonuclease HI